MGNGNPTVGGISQLPRKKRGSRSRTAFQIVGEEDTGDFLGEKSLRFECHNIREALGFNSHGQKPLDKPLENPPETQFLFYDMSKLPIFGLFSVVQYRKSQADSRAVSQAVFGHVN